ncbi:MAG TPA: DNA-processing protein DprA [Burkholderiaceae bacterium]|nr:DNA-processing protein DprA [Burkholderiaceae bacterium]
MAAENGLAAWVRLEQTAGVGPETARKLLAAFGLPENIFSAGFSALRSVVSERIALALTSPASPETQALIARTLEWANQPGNVVLTLADDDYPPLLLDIADPPILLYVKGRVELLRATSLAVVGSRNATTQGVANAGKFAETVSQAGIHTVSGLALGIDSAAHEGSLRSFKLHGNAGSTIAVIGTGIDIVYPARNRDLAHQIAVNGCIVSEYPLGMPAIPANFPRRNRIISGLARGTLVVEAAAQSGSLITARMAAEQGREVFAIPGSIHSPLSKGCHQLIKQGAKLVESAEDILEELTNFIGKKSLSLASAKVMQISKNDHPLLASMGFDPVDADTLATLSGLDAASLSAQLLGLELEGAVEMLPGGAYRRIG